MDKQSAEHGADAPEKVRRGDFPFPIRFGASESRYLTWMRNHSNYMVVRGISDWFRAGSILVRGVILNLVIIMPALIGVAMLIAIYSVGELNSGWLVTNIKLNPFTPPFSMTKFLLLLCVLSVLLWAIASSVPILAKFFGSSVKWRDRVERGFGLILLVVLVLFGFEAIVAFLPTFHNLKESTYGIQTIGSIASFVAVLLSSANKLLSGFRGAALKLATLTIGLLGLLLPLLAIFFISDYLIYGKPEFPWTDWLFWGVIVVVVFSALYIILYLFLRLRKNSTLPKGVLFRSLGLIVVIALGFYGYFTNGYIVSAIFSPGGSNVLTIDNERNMEVWDIGASSGTAENWTIRLTGNFPPAISPDDLTVLVLDGGAMQLKSLYDGELLVELERDIGDFNYSLDPQFSPLGTHFLTFTSDNALLWDSYTGGLLKEIPHSVQAAENFEIFSSIRNFFSPDGNNVLTFSEGSFRISRSMDGELIQSLAFRNDDSLPQSFYYASFSTDSRYVVSTSDESVYIWDMNSAAEINTSYLKLDLYDNSRYTQEVVFNSDATCTLTLTDNNSQEVTAVTLNGVDCTHFIIYDSSVFLYSEDGRSALSFYTGNNTVALWKMPTDPEGDFQFVATLPNEDAGYLPYTASFMANGSRILTFSENQAKLWESDDGGPLQTIPNDEAAYYSQVMTPVSADGTRFLTFSNGSAQLWNAQEGVEIDDFLSNGEADVQLYEVEFSADGKYVLTYSNLGWQLWDSSTGKEDTSIGGNEILVEKLLTLFVIAVLLFWYSRAVIDVNRTSLHALYRDRLAEAFLVGEDNKGDIDIERDLDLAEICRHEAGSRAPYHLINTTLNLQGSKELRIRDRKSDFFVFSKKFIGGELTHYCRSESMERVFPQMGLGTAMAISAAAASPNMGQGTNSALVPILTLLNIRLGIWIPNPDLLERDLRGIDKRDKSKGDSHDEITFAQVFSEELDEISHRWEQLDESESRHRQLHSINGIPAKHPTTEHGLVGLAFSGGGIRSATVNLGITQALESAGVFVHADYMSTVSGGGYLGSSLSALMRERKSTRSSAYGQVEEISEEDRKGTPRKIVSIRQGLTKLQSIRSKLGFLSLPESFSPGDVTNIEYEDYANLLVSKDDRVKPGQSIIDTTGLMASNQKGKLDKLTRTARFALSLRWKVPANALIREFLGKLDEKWPWINVSDGGHLENLALIELLRRRCRYIIAGDAEADPEHTFKGLATLIRLARLDLDVKIDIKLDDLRLDKNGLCRAHWVCVKIIYNDGPEGYLLYLKSSLTGDEDELIKQYHNNNQDFPHETTADQFFSEGQFEAYRSLGEKIGRDALLPAPAPGDAGNMSYQQLHEWFENLHQEYQRRQNHKNSAVTDTEENKVRTNGKTNEGIENNGDSNNLVT